jgi:hypothetical protein
LLIVDGCNYPKLFTTEALADGRATLTYVELQKIAAKTGAGLVVMENSSDAFDIDEIQRRKVRASLRVKGRFAIQSHCAVMVLVHFDMV